MSNPLQASAPLPSEERLDPYLVRMTIILLIGSLAPLLDTTITNVAIHTLGEALHASVSSIQWVMTSYLLALGMIIPFSGWALERFGGKRVWIFALTVFLAGSLLCSVAWNLGSLIVFRAIQGLGGGLMIPVMQTMLVRAAGNRKLGKLMAVAGLPALIGPILGPVLGGIIVDQLDWRWIFYVNLPVCILAIALAWRGLANDPPSQHAGRPDVTGLLLITPSLVLLIYGLAEVGPHHGFGHGSVLLPLLLGAVLLILFVFHTLFRTRNPVIDIRLFKLRSFSASTVLLFLSGLSTYGGMLLLPMFYQQVRGEGILVSGLLLVPQGVGMLLTRSLAGKLTDQIGPRPVVIGGLLLTALGTLPFTMASADTSLYLLGGSLIIRGAGLGAVFLPLLAASYQGLKKEDIAHASTATRIIQQIGGAFGASVLAVILEHQLTGLSSVGAMAAQAYDRTFLWSLCFTVVGLLPAALLPRIRRISSGQAG